MMFRRASALLLAAAFAALARPVLADDAQTAAAMQAIGQAGVATGGAPGAKKKDEGGFSRALSAPQIQKTTDGDQERAPAKKRASVKSKPSKYKSRALTENSEHVYRFNGNAEPLNAAPKKKAAAKIKKKTPSASDDDGAKADACSSDETCAAKKSDGDAF